MLGKILGISFVGLTQFLAWSILTIMINILAMPFIALSGSGLNSNSSSVVATQDVDMSAKIMQEMMNIEWGEFAIVFFLFFMGGYFLYASIFAAIGAMLNDDSELQSMMFIVMIPIFTAYIIGLSAAQDPNNSLAFWSSMVPFFSPIIMMSIWPYVPLWHIIVSLLILLFSVIFMTHISAKLYRASILMYGQKATIGKFFKLLIN
jgi:ABC-2 type transport system permease protein